MSTRSSTATSPPPPPPLEPQEQAQPRADGEAAATAPAEPLAAASASASPPSPRPDESAAASPASAPDAAAPAPAPRKTRLLKDVEAEENRYIYETLYKSLDDTTDTAIRDALTVGDTVRLAREAKQEFTKAATMPLGEKAKGCTALLRSFSQAQNQQVAYVFIVFSVLMMTTPVIALLLGMKVIAPWLEADPTLCGGGLAVLTAVTLMTAYVVYAMVEDAQRVRRETTQAATAKKQQ